MSGLINPRALVTDLDGTLIHSDLFVESLLGALRQNAWLLFQLPGWLLKGRGYLKARLAALHSIDVEHLPYNRELLRLLNREKARGRTLVLATGADRRYAEQVAERLDLFDAVYASDADVNLKSWRKAALLVDTYGSKGFDYIGDSTADLPVWASADSAVVVSGSRRLVQQAEAVTRVSERLPPGGSTLRAFLRACRLHHWTKNILIFVPMMTAHLWTDSAVVLAAVLAFLAFGICASSVYLLNDLLDVQSDRLHRSKRNRPFASGELPVRTGLVAIPVMLAIAAGIALLLPPAFGLILVGYFALTTLYSLVLKRQPIVDVLTLTAFYGVRILAGAAATGVVPSVWLLAFAGFLFLSLAFVKRYTELIELKQSGRLAASGRSYVVDDSAILLSLGSASGYLAVLVFALYLNTAIVKELYRTPQLLWLICPLVLYWISRVWLLANRGQMPDDPVVFAMKDRISQCTWLIVALVVILATNFGL